MTCPVGPAVPLLLLLLSLVPTSMASTACDAIGLVEAPLSSAPDGFCVSVFATGFASPRGVIVLETGEVLVVELGASRIVLLVDSDDSGTVEPEETIILFVDEVLLLTHGIAFHDNYLYASSPTVVYRWPFEPSQRTALDNSLREVVVQDIRGGDESGLGGQGGHSTRTLKFDIQDRLYVQVGSQRNIDPNPGRSLIRRFAVDGIPTGGWRFPDGGELVATGLRNEVAMAFDKHNVLWGAENGADNLERADMGGELYNTNPAEELNRFPEANLGKAYGYPYCWSEFDLPEKYGKGLGTQFAWPDFLDDGTVDDSWCQDPQNVEPPAMAMQAHSAPLGMVFYPAVTSDKLWPFPDTISDDLFVGFHGSWNKDVPTGCKVVRVEMDELGATTGTQPVEFLGSSTGDCDWQYRPVDVAIGPEGDMYITAGAGCTWTAYPSRNTHSARCDNDNGVVLLVRYVALQGSKDDESDGDGDTGSVVSSSLPGDRLITVMATVLTTVTMALVSATTR